ncbi:MAG: Gfo/Idh/MocA family oxidoreductase [Phycisphaerales bacterium]|jgi:predicted dehydrogenase|nr:Gfo/Idh/MocA family oxidoreductase [Phycisphaerales bacterium]
MNQHPDTSADDQNHVAVPVRFGCVGLGGYAGASCEFLERCEGDSSIAGAIRLTAVCEPDQRRHAGAIKRLRGRGVRVVEKYEDLLNEPVEAIWLPLPIDLHRPYTIQALEAAKGVLCEKPAAGSVDDVDAMIAARDRLQQPVLIGYQHMYHPATAQIKRLLLDGAIGSIRSASVCACWPRSTDYFSRNDWVGRYQRDGAWVMDSPANNALAHYLNLSLFLLGESVSDSAALSDVEAELYRANAIETNDTAALRITTQRGIPLLALLTHACGESLGPIIRVDGTEGSLTLVPDGQTTMTTRRSSQNWPAYGDCRSHMISSMRQLIREGKTTNTTATLETSRAQTVVINAASQVAPVHKIPQSMVRQVAVDNQQVRAVRGIESLFEQCVSSGKLPHESGQVDWSVPAKKLSIRDYQHFTGPCRVPSAS